MSHVHLPDGIIPVFWWILGYLITGSFLAVAFYRIKPDELRRKVPLLGIMAALMLIGQSVLGIGPFHLNLAVLSGIALGPWLGIIAVFVSTIFLSILGHGGITVVGLNTMVVGSEAVLGYLLYASLKNVWKSDLPAVIVACALTLVLSISFMVGIVALANVNPGLLLEEAEDQAPQEVASISVTRFISIITPFAAIGIFIESLVTGFTLRFLLSVRPDIVKR